MNAMHTGPRQFTLDLLEPPEPTLENFVAGANGAALAALREARTGGGPAFVHLWGPAGSGKTHLLAALAGPEPAPGSAPVPRFAPGRRLYVVDDVHRLDEAGQAALFALQDEIRQAEATGGPRLVTASDVPPAHLALREDVRTRLAWGLVFGLRLIAETEQAAALLAYAGARGARVDEDLIPYMLSRLPRDMRTLVSVLDALDAYALARHRSLTIPLLRDWLRETEN